MRFHVATASGQPAWLSRFRIYVPNYSNNTYEYTVKTTTNFSLYDLYYFAGFADDYIRNFKVDSTQWYEWQWKTATETIYAWNDGFLYPVFNSKENGIFNVEFTFGETNVDGLLDFQYLSWELQKQRIGRPKFHMTTSITPRECDGAKLVMQKTWSYGGSSWCNQSGYETEDPIDYEFISQKIRVITNGTMVNQSVGGIWDGLEYLQEANLGISVGFAKLDPRENDFVDIAILFNLTSGSLYHSYWEGNETADPWYQADHGVFFEPTQIEIWTPPCAAIETPALVYNDTSSVSFISPPLKVAAPFMSTFTSGLIVYAFMATASTLLAGPCGILIAASAASVVYQFFNYAGGQTIVRSYEDPGNATYRRLHSDQFGAQGDNPFSTPNNVTQALFIRLKAVQRYHCGALKIKIRGMLGLSYSYWVGGSGLEALVPIPLEVETTLIMPIFVRD